MRGFTLVEVMISAAIFLIILLAQTSQTVEAQREYYSIEKKLVYSELQNFIVQIVSHPSICTKSLAGKPGPLVGLSVPTLSFGNVNIDDFANNIFANSIQVISLKYTAVSIVGSSTEAVITLVVNLQLPGGVPVVGGNIPKSVSFPMTLNVAGGVIQNCL